MSPFQIRFTLLCKILLITLLRWISFGLNANKMCTYDPIRKCISLKIIYYWLVRVSLVVELGGTWFSGKLSLAVLW